MRSMGQTSENPSIYAGFRFFCFAQIKPCSIQKVRHYQGPYLGRVVVFFFVSITLFVEIMSRISNCFFNFKLRCEKGDDFFESPPLAVSY